MLSACRPDLKTMPFFLGLVSNNQLDAVRTLKCKIRCGETDKNIYSEEKKCHMPGGVMATTVWS